MLLPSALNSRDAGLAHSVAGYFFRYSCYRPQRRRQSIRPIRRTNDSVPTVPRCRCLTLGPTSRLPQIVGAQYSFILQNQSTLASPYAEHLSLDPKGDTQPTNTVGLYLGWAPLNWLQAYVDVERFVGAGVSNATGLAGLTNGDVVREGAAGLKKEFYFARDFLRFMLPLGDGVTAVDRAKDQIGGGEASTRLELKVGRMAVNDDFDNNRYAGDPRGEFLNWSLWANTAWDYAANTRGYTDGIVLGFVSSAWSLKYGIYRMPVMANGQQLVSSLTRANGQNLQLTLSDLPTGTIVRLLGFFNTASMGLYRQALEIAAADHTIPNIVADDRPGRQKHGYGLNFEQPIADEGETGAFLRWGWNDGNEESFAFTEVDELVSFGAQLSGSSLAPAERSSWRGCRQREPGRTARAVSGGGRQWIPARRWASQLRPRADSRGVLQN